MKKKLVSMLLTFGMVTALFAGCGKNTEGGESTEVQNTEEGSEESKESESGTDAAESSVTENSTSENNTPANSDSDAIVGNIPVKFPIVDEPLTLKIMASVGTADYNDVYVWQKYEEMTGINVDWVQMQGSEKGEKIAAALSTGDYADLIFRCRLSQETLTEYGEQGLIVDLNENNMLETYAPNTWNYLQTHPDTLASVMSPDGKIYSLPQVNSGAELRVSRKLFINKKWLENVNMEVPATTEELYQVLKAFKEQDANGNGDPDDEIPFCTQDWAGFQDVFLGAFGLGNRGQHNQIVDYDEENNCVRLIGVQDEYKQMLEYMNRLYKEGLVDQELFSMDTANWTTKANDDRIGVFAFTNLASLPYSDHSDWIGIEEALEGPEGHKFWSPVRANFHTVGNAVIPETCEHIPEVLQWLDYFWTDEGTLFYHYGIEGETFVANDDGTYDYSESVLSQVGDGASFDDVVARYSPYPGGGNPTVEVAPYFGGGEMEEIPATAAKALFEYRPDVIWPSFTFTSQESSELNIIQTDIKKYIDAARTEFIVGSKSFDEWDSYVAAIENMNLETMLEIYQAASDRFDALSK